MNIYDVALILVAGVVAGFMNTVGGGGSLISLPVLIFMGLPSAVANGTNRIALLVQSIVAVENFRRGGFIDLRLSLLLGMPAMLGSLAGVYMAITMPDAVFNRVLAVVMLVVLVLIIWQPEKKFLKNGENLTTSRKAAAAAAFFFIGVYGGFIQAGAGFLIIVALSLITGMSLVRINGQKNLVVGLYILTSLILFMAGGKVDWVIGLTLAVGNGIGGWLGSSFAMARGDKWIRVFLVICVVLMAAKLLGLFDAAAGLLRSGIGD